MEVLLDTCGRLRVRYLLLIYLFVLKAAADCPRLQGMGNMILTNEALLMNDFPDGIVATLECANGYVKESGSGTITCNGGIWSEPDLICKKKDCGPPTAQPNMSFNISDGTLFEAVIKVICDKGYEISGSSYKQCFSSGWVGRAKCEIVECDKPAEVINGRSSWDFQDDPQYGDSIRYTCDLGYTLIGKDVIRCLETGEYDSQPPECKEALSTTESSATPTAHRDKTITTSTVSSSVREALSSTDSSATPTAHRDKTITTPTVSPSARGGRYIVTAGDKDKATTASVTSTTSSSFQDKHGGIADTNKDTDYTPVIISVICVSLAACIIVALLHRFFLKRKGSYDTREDLKPELLQFQKL